MTFHPEGVLLLTLNDTRTDSSTRCCVLVAGARVRPDTIACAAQSHSYLCHVAYHCTHRTLRIPSPSSSHGVFFLLLVDNKHFEIVSNYLLIAFSFFFFFCRVENTRIARRRSPSDSSALYFSLLSFRPRLTHLPT